MFGYADTVEIDFVVNGRVNNGSAFAHQAERVSFDTGLLRPMIMDDGKKYCWVANGKPKRTSSGQIIYNEAGVPVPDRDPVPLSRLIANGMCPAVFNTSALPYQTWFKIDTAVMKASRDRLNAWNDIAAANTYGGFNGMAVTGLIRDAATDPGSAKVSMDKLENDLNDTPLLTPDILPLPIIHAGCEIGPRRLAQMRNSGVPLDTDTFEACGRRCAETLESMTIGVTDYTGFKIGQASVPAFSNMGIYGFRTHPDRITKTDVTASGSFVAATFVQDVIAMRELARAQRFYGPFVLYYSTSWDQYLARDYYVITSSGAAAPTKTVMQRVAEINNIQRVAMLDYFTNTDELLLVQMTSETVRAVVGMDWTPVQYEKPGGAGVVYRVMGIKVPDLRSQYVGTSTTSRKCGIVHGTTS